MTKTELVKAMAEDSGITAAQAKAALDSFVNNVTGALKKKNGKVTLVGFGTFLKARRKARNGRNPQTGRPHQDQGGKRSEIQTRKEASGIRVNERSRQCSVAPENIDGAGGTSSGIFPTGAVTL